jgi:hypothetical protein
MRATGRIHAGRTIKPGGRYDRVLGFLRSRGTSGATTLEIVRQAAVCAVNSTVSELRAMGYQIDCHAEGRDPVGAAIYRYRLVVLATEAVQRDLFREGA